MYLLYYTCIKMIQREYYVIVQKFRVTNIFVRFYCHCKIDLLRFLKSTVCSKPVDNYKSKSVTKEEDK